MGDTLSWGSKLDEFCKWVDSASIQELKNWLSSVKGREWAYRDEIPIVEHAIKNSLQQPRMVVNSEAKAVQTALTKALRIKKEN